jgi:NAD(P)H-hydrate repair Nnr-like enzyme with NAD(P)H-hydrate epimerase domain
MKTAISVPDATFARVDAAADRLGMSRSEFFSRAAERWLSALDDDGTTAQIDAVLAGGGAGDTDAFVAAAARRPQADDGSW